MRPLGENPETSVQLRKEKIFPQRPAVWHRSAECFIMNLMSILTYNGVHISSLIRGKLAKQLIAIDGKAINRSR